MVNSVVEGSDIKYLVPGAIVSAPNALADGTKIKTAKEDPSTLVSIDGFVNHGNGNDVPEEWAKAIENNTVLTGGLRLLTRLLYGGGIVVGKFAVENNKRDFQYVDAPEFYKWAKRTQLSRQYFTQLYDIQHFAYSVVLLTLSADGKTITRATTEFTRAKWCRFKTIGKTNVPTDCVVTPDMGKFKYRSGNSVTYPVCPIYGGAEWIRENLKGGESCVVIVKNVDTGRQYYPLPPFVSAINSNWVSIAGDVAVFNKAILDNGVNIKYHLEFHPDFWPAKFGEEIWRSLTPEQKKAKADTFIEEMKGFLTGAKNADAVIASAMKNVEFDVTKAPYSLLKITLIEGKIASGKDGAYLNVGRESSQHTIMAMELDPSLVGVLPGDSGMGAGSGSNNRVAFNQRVLLAKPEQDMYSEWLNIVAEYNKWPAEWEFTTEQGLITTLDAGAETAKQVPNSNNKGANG